LTRTLRNVRGFSPSEKNRGDLADNITLFRE
jgi:hypothetical protein